MFSQCQCNIVRSLSCYNATVRMSLHQPNVTLIYPADSERQQRPTWDVFLSVIDRFCAIHADSHRRSTETIGAPAWSEPTLPNSSAEFAALSLATGVLNTPYPVSLNLPLFYFIILWANYRSVHKWQFPIFVPFWIKVNHVYIKDMHTSELNISLKNTKTYKEMQSKGSLSHSHFALLCMREKNIFSFSKQVFCVNGKLKTPSAGTVCKSTVKDLCNII